MISKIIHNKVTLPFVLIFGMGIGYLYWKIIGCTSGTCPMSSTPFMNIITGGAIAYLSISIVQESVKK